MKISLLVVIISWKHTNTNVVWGLQRKSWFVKQGRPKILTQNYIIFSCHFSGSFGYYSGCFMFCAFSNNRTNESCFYQASILLNIYLPDGFYTKFNQVKSSFNKKSDINDGIEKILFYFVLGPNFFLIFAKFPFRGTVIPEAPGGTEFFQKNIDFR